ncbi:MAG: phytanoyl-CoA dioxygenase family protein [Candidatus Methylumidiphilus sp.]
MDFAEHGYALLPDLLPADAAQALLDKLAGLPLGLARGGIRRIAELLPDVAALAASPGLLAVAAGHLAGAPRLVRAIYFDKSPGHNWSVAWHQDKTVAVSERFAAAGWGPWSIKAGAWHVQPPVSVLEDMVTLRVHLDPATRANGCLKVVQGSHRAGLLAGEAMRALVRQGPVVYCESPSGGGLLMRPHILHASEKASAPLPRRLLHFEYSSYPLPAGIAWAT